MTDEIDVSFKIHGEITLSKNRANKESVRCILNGIEEEAESQFGVGFDMYIDDEIKTCSGCKHLCLLGGWFCNYMLIGEFVSVSPDRIACKKWEMKEK